MNSFDIKWAMLIACASVWVIVCLAVLVCELSRYWRSRNMNSCDALREIDKGE